MNKFNRILLASGLAATASLMANSPAFAGTTGTINLSGTIDSVLSITVSPSANSGGLNLGNGNHSDVTIGTVTGASSNSQNGLKVVLTSTWELKSGSNTIPITKISEAAGYVSVPTTRVDTSTLSSIGYTLVNTQTSAPGLATPSTIFIDYDVPSGQATGTYSGSITFTVSDK
jgi:hypothetical protein